MLVRRAVFIYLCNDDNNGRYYRKWNEQLHAIKHSEEIVCKRKEKKRKIKVKDYYRCKMQFTCNPDEL